MSKVSNHIIRTLNCIRYKPMSETTIVFQHCELCANYSVRDSLFDIITICKKQFASRVLCKLRVRLLRISLTWCMQMRITLDYIFTTCRFIWLIDICFSWLLNLVQTKVGISSSSVYLKNLITNRRNDGFDLLLLNHLSLANVDAGKSIKTTANKLPYTMNRF